YYRIKSPAPASAGAPVVMTAMIWGLEANKLDPRVSLYDANSNLVPDQVLVSENHTYTIQVANAVPGATYYVKAAAARPQGTNNVGNYFLGVDFSSKAVAINDFTSGTLVQGSSQAFSTMTVEKSSLV